MHLYDVPTAKLNTTNTSHADYWSLLQSVVETKQTMQLPNNPKWETCA